MSYDCIPLQKVPLPYFCELPVSAERPQWDPGAFLLPTEPSHFSQPVKYLQVLMISKAEPNAQ